jgi:uncharacterized membrane protein
VNSDLIVMTFDDGEMAQTVHEALRAMRKSQVLGLGDSVIMTTDGAGQVRLHRGSEAGTGLAPLLAEMILCSTGGEAPGLDGVGLDDEFVDTVVAALRRNHSALLFFIDSDGLSDTCELLNALALFCGTIHQTTLSPQSEALLRGSLG